MYITVFTRAPNDNSRKGKRGSSEDDVAVKELEGLNVSTYRRDRSTVLKEFHTLKMWTVPYVFEFKIHNNRVISYLTYKKIEMTCCY
jgi:hypothetical protein